MPRQGTHTPRQTAANKAQQQKEIENAANREAELMLEIRDAMGNVHEGIRLEHAVAELITSISNSTSPMYVQILNVALGNIRKLNTNFLYKEHTVLESIIPLTEMGTEEEIENADIDPDEDDDEGFDEEE